jgi:predicted DNA-binding protein (UPF0251 family)
VKGAAMKTLELTFAEDVGQIVPEQARDTLETLAREALVVRLYDLEYLSSRQAARLLQISRWDFLDLLGHYHISWFDEQAEILVEAS